MSGFTRILLLAGLTLVFVTTWYASSVGMGLTSLRNAKLIRSLNKDCPPELRDQYGNCQDRTYRSTYYGVYILGSGTRGGGGK